MVRAVLFFGQRPLTSCDPVAAAIIGCWAGPSAIIMEALGYELIWSADAMAWIKDVVPLGIVGLAIVAVLLVALNPGGKTNLKLAAGTIAAIVLLAVFDKLTPQSTLQPAPPKVPDASSPAGAPGGIFWIDTTSSADWGGRDVASTTGLIPRYRVKDMRLCDENRNGSIAVCWDNRPNGFPAGVPTDISGAPAQWCTYKDSSVKLSTPPDGRAPPGRVYLCARSIPHT